MLEKQIANIGERDPKRRENIQKIYSQHTITKGRNLVIYSALPAWIVIGSIFLNVNAGLRFFVGLLGAVTTACLIGKGIQVMRSAKLRVYIVEKRGYGEIEALKALDALMNVIREAGRDARKTQKAADLAIDKLQDLVPGTPLSNLIRWGYYPSRPEVTQNDRVRIVDNDKDSIQEHWSRTVESIEKLRSLLESKGVILERDVRKAVSNIVPPLRAIMRAAGIRTHRIEYIVMAALNNSVSPADVGGTSVIETQPDRGADVGIREEIDQRLNASGKMAYISLKALISSFHGAEAALFVGDDRTTGDQIIDRHLPDLEAAFLMADDAAPGEEKDVVRADFAKSLKLLASTLEGIMGRHAQVAHDLLKDKARFIEMRHGTSELAGN